MNAYVALVVGYAAGLSVLTFCSLLPGPLWRAEHASSSLTWQMLIAMVGGILVLGQLYRAGMFIPEHGPWRTSARAINQAIIFLPVWMLAIRAMMRGDVIARATSLLPTRFVPARLGIGAVSALTSIALYAAVRVDAPSVLVILCRVMSGSNIPYAVQILGEDVGIGLLVAMLMARLGERRAAWLAAVCFALAHLPAMLGHADAASYVRLVGDGLLTAGVLLTVIRLRDLWPLWPMHVAMDLMQFHGGR